MKKKQYSIHINAPVEKVFTAMLGLEDKSTYEAWTALFNPSSTFEGSWDKGGKIYFVGSDEHGNRGGMIAEIEEHIPNKFISIRPYGILEGTKEIISGEKVDSWVGGHENYTFSAKDGVTTVLVEIDVVDEYTDYFNNTYPNALEKLKEICE